ncbi:MAG: DUF3352 domain-containing protein [Candidatus Limnocylindrales bacterium]
MSSPTTAPKSRRSVARWTVAAFATGALVVSGSGLVAFAQSGAGESQGPAFVPADAVAYVEARLDMPGGQADAVAEMLTAFPGFADAGSFDMKLDEAIAGLGAQAGLPMPEGDLVGDVLTGEIGLAVSDFESLMAGGDPSLIIGLATADAEAAGAYVETLMSGGATLTESTYNDVTITTDDSQSPPMSVALHSDWLLIGTGEEMIQSSIDVLDGAAPGLAAEADFTDAWGRLPASRLGGVYVDLTPFGALLDMATMVAGAETGVELPPEQLAALIPKDMVASLAAERDRLNLEVLVSPAEGQTNRTEVMRESDIALSFPVDTQVYLEMPDFGNGVQTLLEQAVATLEAQDMSPGTMGDELGMAEIEALIGEDSPITALLGAPLPEYLDFVGDTGVGAGLSSDGLWLGIAGDVVDAEAADERVTSLLTVLRMFLLGAEEEGVGIDTAEVAGVEVTTITLPVDEMLAEEGVPLALGDSIDIALTDDQLLIGLGDFVENALIADPADSLGASAGYVDALGADVVNAGVTYVNVSALLAALDPMLAMMAPEWEMISPFATGVDRMIVVPTVDDEVSRARMSVIVGR